MTDVKNFRGDSTREPFVDRLVILEGVSEDQSEWDTSHITRLMSHPELVIKRAQIPWATYLESVIGANPHTYPHDKYLEKLVELLSESQQEIYNLRDREGFNIPLVGMTIAQQLSSTQPLPYVITKRVTGTALTHPENASQCASDDILALGGKILAYYSRVVSGGGRYLRDIHGGQFMYGTVPNETKPDFYLVDLDPNIDSYDHRHPSQRQVKTLAGSIGMVIEYNGLLGEYCEEQGIAGFEDLERLNRIGDNLLEKIQSRKT